jgi:hypothetical protein
VLKEIHAQVQDADETLSMCKVDETELPATLDLRGPQSNDPKDPANIQFRNLLSWDVPFNEPDPGQQVALQKYVPVDLLQVCACCELLCMTVSNDNHYRCRKKLQLVVKRLKLFGGVIACVHC